MLLDKRLRKTLEYDMAAVLLPKLADLVNDIALDLTHERDGELENPSPFTLDEFKTVIVKELCCYLAQADFDDDFGLIHPHQLSKPYFEHYYSVSIDQKSE